MNAWAQDKSLDVAVAPINADALKALGMNGLDFFTADTSATREKVKQLGMSEGDGVFILGFPNLGPNTTISGTQDFVIVRRGTISRISDFEQGLNKRYLVDGFVFPGNSGGPVVNVPEIVSITGTSAVKNAYLIGMVRSYLPYQDVAVSQQTQEPRIIFEENSGLAEVVPVDDIETVIQPLLSAAKPQVPATNPNKH
jgi:hypothetical protein